MKTFSGISKMLVVFFCAFYISGYSKEKTDVDTVIGKNNDVFPKPDKYNLKNPLMLNITNPVLLSIQFQTIAYERILKN